MTPLPDPFDTLPDWSLDPANYPSVFLIDEQWARDQHFLLLDGSEAADPLVGPTPLAPAISGQPEKVNHGEQTQHVIQYMARGLRNANITRISVKQARNSNLRLPEADLAQAVFDAQTYLTAGDLVVLNVGYSQASESFACDPHIGPLLHSITNDLGGIVVLSAGNTLAPLIRSWTRNAIVVGAVDRLGQMQSRYGKHVTCYGVTPYNLPGLSAYPAPVEFVNSSAATAYMAGMVLMMLNYAKSTGQTLTGKKIIRLLKNTGKEFVLSYKLNPFGTGILPDWDRLRPAIGRLRNSAK